MRDSDGVDSVTVGISDMGVGERTELPLLLALRVWRVVEVVRVVVVRVLEVALLLNIPGVEVALLPNIPGVLRYCHQTNYRMWGLLHLLLSQLRVL